MIQRVKSIIKGIGMVKRCVSQAQQHPTVISASCGNQQWGNILTKVAVVFDNQCSNRRCTKSL